MVEKYSIYKDIATRTNGDIYIGVVGPVRTGKSTFINYKMITFFIEIVCFFSYTDYNKEKRRYAL